MIDLVLMRMMVESAKIGWQTGVILKRRRQVIMCSLLLEPEQRTHWDQRRLCSKLCVSIADRRVCRFEWQYFSYVFWGRGDVHASADNRSGLWCAATLLAVILCLPPYSMFQLFGWRLLMNSTGTNGHISSAWLPLHIIYLLPCSADTLQYIYSSWQHWGNRPKALFSKRPEAAVTHVLQLWGAIGGIVGFPFCESTWKCL